MYTKPWNLLLWNCLVFFFNYTCIYNRKFMRFIILQLHEFTCTIYPTVLFFFYRFSSWPWLVRIIPDQQIPLWFITISVKSTPHSFKTISPKTVPNILYNLRCIQITDIALFISHKPCTFLKYDSFTMHSCI